MNVLVLERDKQQPGEIAPPQGEIDFLAFAEAQFGNAPQHVGAAAVRAVREEVMMDLSKITFETPTELGNLADPAAKPKVHIVSGQEAQAFGRGYRFIQRETQANLAALLAEQRRNFQQSLIDDAKDNQAA